MRGGGGDLPQGRWRREGETLTPHFFKNLNLHETSAGVVSGAFPGAQNGSLDDPRSTQHGSKTIFKVLFFRLRFYLRFWSVLGPVLAPFWVHLGSLLGAQNLPK